MRTPWSFSGYQWHVNPNEDTGFIYEPVFNEEVPINASSSKYQYGGMKAGKREISGWLFGDHAMEQYTTMLGWLRNRTISTLTDHLGQSQRAMMVKFDVKIVNDATAYKNNRITATYSATFVTQ